jgi:hypothetical protein
MRGYMKGLSVLILALLLSGCSAMDVVKGIIKPEAGLHVETEIVAGDKSEEVKVGGQEAETITNNNEFPLGVAIFAGSGWVAACFGFLLPSASDCWGIVRGK